MIHTIRIRGFKRFRDVEFRLPGHVVLTGPNDAGKTTVLQAVASWALALRRWRELNDFNKRRGYVRAPITRQAFTAVPLRNFDLLWTDRRYRKRIEIEIRHADGWAVTMEFIPDSTEHIYVRPTADAPADMLRDLDFRTVFVPPMTGLAVDEPLFHTPKIEHLLGQGRPGEVLRNLLAEAKLDEAAWERTRASIEKLFGYEILPPDAYGAHILAEYRKAGATGPRFDVAGAGSGFQQVSMLFAFLNTRPGSVLLLDEPDAHLNVVLQGAVYHELRTAAALQRSQLIVATNSEAVIDAADPREIYVVLDEPRRIADDAERSRLVSSRRGLSNTDAMRALAVRGVLYVKDCTDIGILRAWAAALGHRGDRLLTIEAMWAQADFQGREGGSGVGAREHFEALRLVRDDLPGLELVDGDSRLDIPGGACAGLQRLRWRRYEIESYLLHPDALARFAEAEVGSDAAGPRIEDMRACWEDEFPPAVARDPLTDHEYLNVTEARTRLLPRSALSSQIPFWTEQGMRPSRFLDFRQILVCLTIAGEIGVTLPDFGRAAGRACGCGSRP